MSEVSAAKFEASLQVCQTQQQRTEMLNTPRGRAFTHLNQLKAQTIGALPHFSILPGQSKTPTCITSTGVSFEADKSLVKPLYFNSFSRKSSLISQYELLRCYHFVVAKHKTFSNFEEALEQYRSIRPDVPPTEMSDLLILAMKMYCEVFDTKLNFASGPTFSKSALEQAGVSVLDF